MAENLLIVESPGKIKKLQLILGAGWRIMPTIGHIRTLTNDGENNLGFELKDDRINCHFKPKNSKAKRIIQELQKAAQVAARVCVATDPDPEGEMIAWHVYEILDHPNIVRVSFSEITEKAVKKAIALPRKLDLNLVESGLARSCLDKLIEKKCSPLVRNIGVKSVALVPSAVSHLICERQKEIKNFKSISYFSVSTRYNNKFLAYFSHDENNVQSSIPDEQTQIQESNRIYSQQEAEELASLREAPRCTAGQR